MTEAKCFLLRKIRKKNLVLSAKYEENSYCSAACRELHSTFNNRPTVKLKIYRSLTYRGLIRSATDPYLAMQPLKEN